MKSIMEEASSIFKAIEKAWQTAGKPKEFSVKVLEEPQKNFIGLTIKSAKVAIFFNNIQKTQLAQPAQPYKPKLQKEKPFQPKPSVSQNIITQQKKELVVEKPELIQQQPSQPIWTEPMMSSVKEWLTQTLNIINKKNINFSIEPQRYHLKIKFEQSVYDEAHRQKQLFASLATLILQMLKNKYRRPLRGYKIILTT
ncbi:MAG: hypothetical protein ACYC2U_08185 [Candidatus Amoebophilus sp.]